jgi:hypothetical protein
MIIVKRVMLKKDPKKPQRTTLDISCSRWIEYQWCKSHTFGINFHMTQKATHDFFK